MTNQCHSTIAAPSPGPYHCETYRDGTEDTIDIVASDGTVIATTQYWDDYGESGACTKATMILLSGASELRVMLRRLLDLAKHLPTTSLDADFYAAELEAEELLTSLIVRLP